MEDVTRRDAAKIATGGLLAAGMLAVAGASQAEGQERKASPKRGGLGGAAAKIDGIVLPATLGASLGGSPEDAAKVFMRAASQGLAQVVANALVTAVGSAVGTLGKDAAPPDWTKLIKGCVMNMIWDSPPKTALETTTALSPGVEGALGGVSVSVGISASF